MTVGVLEGHDTLETCRGQRRETLRRADKELYHTLLEAYDVRVQYQLGYFYGVREMYIYRLCDCRKL